MQDYINVGNSTSGGFPFLVNNNGGNQPKNIEKHHRTEKERGEKYGGNSSVGMNGVSGHGMWIGNPVRN